MPKKTVWKRGKYSFIILGIIVLSLLLKLAYLGSFSIHGDEGYSYWEASKPVADMLESIKADPHPPGYYLFLHYWTYLGKGEFMLRLSSVLFSLGAIWLTFIVGRRLFNERTGFFAALLLGFSQIHLRYSQNLRGYELLTFLALLSTYLFILFYKEKRTVPGLLALTTLVNLIGVYTHYFMAFIIIAQTIYLIVNYKKMDRRIIWWIGANLILLLLFIPGLMLFNEQISLKTDFEKGLDGAQDEFLGFGANQNNIFLRIIMIFFHITVGFLPVSMNWIFLLCLMSTLVIIITVMIGLKKDLLKHNPPIMLLLLLISCPLIIMSFVWLLRLITPLTYARYFLFMTPFFYLLLVRGLSFLKLRTVCLLIGLILLINVLSMVNYYDIEYNRQDWKEVSRIVENQDSGTILFYPESELHNFKHYYRGNLTIIGLTGLRDLTSYDGISQKDILFSFKTSRNSCEWNQIVHDEQIIVVEMLQPGEEPANMDCGYKLYAVAKNHYRNIWKQSQTDIQIRAFKNISS